MPATATDPAAPRKRALDAFRQHVGGEPQWLVRAPGRVNLLGAHIDYSDGWVLPVAVDRAVWIAGRAASDPDVSRLWALDYDQQVSIDTRSLPLPVPSRDSGADHWADLPRGVAWVLGQENRPVRGVDAVIASDVPIGAGMSSSAALETALFLLWETGGGFAVDGLTRAQLAQRVENEYLGVDSGIMDPFASIHGEPDQALLLDCRDLSYRRIPVPSSVSVLVADSGVRRTLASSDYNRRPEECRRAVELLKPALPSIRALRDVSPEQLERHAGLLTKTLLLRARHAVDECRRVLDGAQALEDRDVAAFGRLMRASHESSRDLYQVSIPELDVLAETAWSADGCYGARLSGAGMGGCVAALVETAALEDVTAKIQQRFEARFGRAPDCFACRVAGGAALEDVV